MASWFKIFSKCWYQLCKKCRELKEVFDLLSIAHRWKNGRTIFIGPKYSSDCSQFAFDKDKQQSCESSFFSYCNRSIIQVLFQKWLIQVCFWQTHVTKYVSHLNKYLTCLWVRDRNPRKYLTNRNLSQNEKNPKLKFKIAKYWSDTDLII